MKSAIPLVALVMLISCTKNDTSKQPPAAVGGGTAPVGAPPAGQPAAATSPAAQPAAAPATPQPVPTPPPPAEPAAVKPLATSEGSLDRVRVEVTELKQSASGTVSLRFTIVNDSGKTINVPDVGLSAGNAALITAADGANYTIGGVHLIDLMGKKKYFVARDSGGSCVCSAFGAIGPGGRGNHWARFASPADNVERLTVVIPPFAPMDDVPLSR